jgi:hypothetical protein
VYIGAITFVIFALSQLASGQSTHYPWVFPGDFRERLRMSDIVLSGIIIHTSQAGTRTVNDTEVTSNIAHVRVDRIFQGTASIEELQFAWFSPHFEMGKQGAIYSGPPLAAFEPGKRYLIFLKPTDLGLEVAMPLYALEVELATGCLARRKGICRNFRFNIGTSHWQWSWKPLHSRNHRPPPDRLEWQRRRSQRYST